MPRKTRANAAIPAASVESVRDLGTTTEDTSNTASAGLFERLNIKLESSQFFSKTAVYTPRDGVCWYVYRLWPVIDRTLGPNGITATKYIAKATEPIDADWLLRHWGAGDYSIHFTDANQPRGKTQIAKTICKLRSEEFAPVLDLAELVLGDPQNRSFIEGLRARGISVGEEENDNMSAANTELAKVASEIIRRESKPAAATTPTQALDLVADAAKQAMQFNNPLAMLQLLKEMNGGNNGQAELVKLLIDSQKQNTEMLLKAIEQMKPSTPAGSFIGNLEDLVKVQSLMDRLGGRGRGSSSSWVGELLGALPDIVSAGVQAAGAWQFAKASTPAAGPAPAPRVVPPNNTHIVPAAFDDSAPIDTVATSAPAPAAAAAGPALPIEIPAELLNGIADQIANCLATGKTGDQFADSVCTFYGDQAYDFARSIGADQLLREMQSRPELWAKLSPFAAHVPQFLADFMAYGDEPETEPAEPLKAVA